MCGLYSAGLGWGCVVGSCEHNNEVSYSIKGREFDQLINDQLLKEEPAPYS